MKAICPKCHHVEYWFTKDTLSPEHLRAIGHEVKCEYDGAECVSASGNEGFHNCFNCTKRGIYNGRNEDDQDPIIKLKPKIKQDLETVLFLNEPIKRLRQNENK